MGCEINAIISWADFQPLAVALDQAAAALNIQFYGNLSTHVISPWSLPNTVAANFWQRFVVLADVLAPGPDFGGGPRVVDRFLAKADGSEFVIAEPALRNLADTGNLYFVADEDNCLCKTIYKVVPEGARYSLATGDSSQCCQSVHVPEIDEKIDYAQDFISASHARQWQKQQGNKEEWRTIATCRSEQGQDIKTTKMQLKPDPFNPGHLYLFAAQRQVSGRFVWPILEELMDELVFNLAYVIANSGGAQESKILASAILRNPSVDAFLHERQCVDIRDMKYSGEILWNWNNLPGCIYEIGELGTLNEWPWNPLFLNFCGIDRCEMGGYKVYCETLKQLGLMIAKLTEVLLPWVAPGCVTGCSYSIEASIYWEDNSDLDLYGKVGNALPVYYGRLTGEGLTLNHDAHPSGGPTPLSPEITSGDFTEGKIFKFWFNLYASGSGTSVPTQKIIVRNTGVTSICVNGNTLDPDDMWQVDAIAFAPNNGSATNYENPTEVEVVCNGC